MQPADKLRLRTALVWLARIVVGCTFIVSGWAKSIDPWGFIIKVNEYLNVWQLSMPREVVLTACVSLSCIEFCTGVLLLSGSLKRTGAMLATSIMAFMLPFSVYVAALDPVSECGCFGDFIVVSNVSTLIKNIVISICSIFLLFNNHRVRGVYAAPIQWLVVTASLVFPLWLAFTGYHVQPVVDFRPYTIGTQLFANSDASDNTVYVYEKDGEQHEFALADIPDDSTWVFVDVREIAPNNDVHHGFEVINADGEDVSADFAIDSDRRLYLIVAEPDMQFLSRAHYVNRLKEYASKHDVDMVGIVGATGSTLSDWVELTRPHFPIYSAEDTALKQLVRGDAALVYVVDGKIRWKRTLSSMDSSLPDDTDAVNILDEVKPVDNHKHHMVALATYLLSLLVIYLLSLSPKILRFFIAVSKKIPVAKKKTDEK